MPTPSRQQSERGFTIVELLIVVAIIGIIAAIAIPNFLQSQQAACTASAVSSLRLIHSSESSYRSSRGRFGDLTALGNDGFINDQQLRNGTKSRYSFTVTVNAADPAAGYDATARPADPTSVTVWRHYYTDATGVVRWRAGAPATAASPVID